MSSPAKDEYVNSMQPASLHPLDGCWRRENRLHPRLSSNRFQLLSVDREDATFLAFLLGQISVEYFLKMNFHPQQQRARQRD
jgi:hypothetical protein